MLSANLCLPWQVLAIFPFFDRLISSCYIEKIKGVIGVEELKILIEQLDLNDECGFSRCFHRLGKISIGFIPKKLAQAGNQLTNYIENLAISVMIVLHFSHRGSNDTILFYSKLWMIINYRQCIVNQWVDLLIIIF